MAIRMEWGFYGRARELQELREILGRKRWFFARITGRRRIGKTTLVQQALRASPGRRVFYVQVPDSAPAGVLSAVRDAMDTFDVPHETHPRPDSLLALAQTIEGLVESGYVVAMDEFQYFSRKHLAGFTSYLRAVVDGLAARASAVPGLGDRARRHRTEHRRLDPPRSRQSGRVASGPRRSHGRPLALGWAMEHRPATIPGRARRRRGARTPRSGRRNG